MAGEEEVVFMNSPLYEHLADVGFTDFEAETLVIPEETRRDKNRHKHEKENGYFIARFIKEATRAFSSSVLQCPTSSSTHQLSSISILKESGLLTDDDSEVVYRFEQCTNIFDISEKLENVPQRSKVPTESKSCGSYALLFVTALAIFMALKISYYIMVTLVVLAGIMVALGYQAWYHVSHHNQKNITTINLYLKLTKELLVLVRKSILFIQEKELLHHGHIFINSKVCEKTSTKNTISVCPILRQCLLNEVKTYIDVLQDKITSLSSTQFFNDTKNLTWLQKYLTSRTYVSNIISGTELSLTNLKEVREYLVSSQSMLLCYVILKSYSMYLNKSNQSDRYFELIQNCFPDLLKSCEDVIGKLRSCHNFHKVEIPEKVTMENSIKIHEVPFVSSIHSMTLHLQELCRLSVKIEGSTETTGNTSMKDHILKNYGEFEDNLSRVKQHLDNVTILWDDSCNRLREMVTIVTIPQYDQKSELSDEKEVLVVDDNIQQPGDSQNHVEDEVFEGDTTFDLADTHILSGQPNYYHEEKATRESRYLLQELKSVLATRGDEKMVSIPKALLSKKVLSEDQDEQQSTSLLLQEKNSEHSDVTPTELFLEISEETSLQTYSGPEMDMTSDQLTDSGKSPCVADCDYKKSAMSISGIGHDRSRNNSEDMKNVGEIEDKTLLLNPLVASMVAMAALARNNTFGSHEEIIGENNCEELYDE